MDETNINYRNKKKKIFNMVFNLEKSIGILLLKYFTNLEHCLKVLKRCICDILTILYNRQSQMLMGFGLLGKPIVISCNHRKKI